jgi:hypothetical protein
MKALGSEIWDFWHNAWPEGYYNDDAAVEVEDDNGGCLLDPATKYDLADFGVICKDGEQLAFADPFSKFFLAWRKKQTTVTFVIEVDKVKADEVKQMLAGINGVKVCS